MPHVTILSLDRYSRYSFSRVIHLFTSTSLSNNQYLEDTVVSLKAVGRQILGFPVHKRIKKNGCQQVADMSLRDYHDSAETRIQKFL